MDFKIGDVVTVCEHEEKDNMLTERVGETAAVIDIGLFGKDICEIDLLHPALRRRGMYAHKDQFKLATEEEIAQYLLNKI